MLAEGNFIASKTPKLVCKYYTDFWRNTGGTWPNSAGVRRPKGGESARMPRPGLQPAHAQEESPRPSGTYKVRRCGRGCPLRTLLRTERSSAAIFPHQRRRLTWAGHLRDASARRPRNRRSATHRGISKSVARCCMQPRRHAATTAMLHETFTQLSPASMLGITAHRGIFCWRTQDVEFRM